MDTQIKKHLTTYYDKLSTKIQIKSILTLPCNKPTIKCIKKLSTKVNIDSTKAIELSMNPNPSDKKTLINSKRLLINGYLSNTLLYISCDVKESICSINFKIPFHTYIILDDNSNISLDKYITKTIIENICTKSIDCKNLCINFNFTILTKKITPTPPFIKKLQNSIIIKSSNNEEVSKIEFNSTDKTFIVTSTDKIPNDNLGAKEYFIIKLKDINTQRTIIHSQIIANENAFNLVSDLNNFNFSFDTNFIELNYLVPANINITNFPNLGQTHMPNISKEFYRITSEGLVPYVPPIPPEPPTVNKLPNSIIIKGTFRNDVARIEFDADKKSFLITSTGQIPDANSVDNTYFSIKLKTIDTEITKTQGIIKSNVNANTFAMTLNGQPFQYNDFLELEYLQPNNITITNFPRSGADYIPNKIKEYFRITPNGLVSYIPPDPPTPPTPSNKLPNSIIIKGTFRNDVARIEFDADKKSFLITSTGQIPDSTSPNNTYFSIKLKTIANEITKTQGIIKSNENANTFAMTLNGQPFQYTDFLELEYLQPNNITITNFPRSGANYIPTIIKEYFRITPNGLVSYTPPTPPTPSNKLPNTIIVKNNAPTRNPVVTIEFDSTNNKLIVASTNSIADTTAPNNIYFGFQILDSNNINIKSQAEILGKDTGSNFTNTLNGKDFNYNDVLRLYSAQSRAFTITNFPIQNQNYNPTNTIEFFKITPQGLVDFVPPTPPVPPPPVTSSKIKLFIRNITNPSNLDEVATIELNNSSSQFKVTSANATISLGLPEYFNFTQLNNLGNILNNISVNNLENINKLNALNNKPFSSGDVVSLRYVNKDLVKVENIKSAPSYMLKDSKDLFKIDNGELTPYTPNKLPNVISFKNEDDSLIGNISFNTDLKIFTVFFTVESASLTSPNDDYFTVKLKDNMGNLKFEEAVKGQDNFSQLAIIFDNKPFEYNDILELNYKETNKVSISNFGNPSTTFVAPGNSSSYIITPAGLQLLANTLKNKIIFKGATDEQISTISFNTDNNRLIVTSSGKIATSTSGTALYFGASLINPFLVVPRSSSVKENENANNFKQELNNLPFKYGDIIEIKYKEKSKVLISNFPNNLIDYTPIKDGKESFIITANGLEKVNILQNRLIIRNTNNSNLIDIYFDTFNKRLKVTDANVTVGTIPSPNVPYYISIELRSSNGALKAQSYVKTSGDSSNIVSTDLNNEVFDFGDIINLGYSDKTKVLLTNYGSLQNFGDSFIIRETGLVRNVSTLTKNAVVVQGINDVPIVTVSFTMPNNETLPQLSLTKNTGTLPVNFFGEEYFKLNVDSYNMFNTLSSSLVFQNPSSTADDFINRLQGKAIPLESIITFNYKESRRVIITTGTIPTVLPALVLTESFRVTLDGLKSTLNVVRFLNSNNTPIGILTFDPIDRKVIIWCDKSRPTTNLSDDEYFGIEVKQGTTMISSSSVKENELASKLEEGLNYTTFNYGNTLTLRYKENQKILISNYPARGPYVYNPDTSVREESFIISPVGLLPLQSVLTNTILVLKGDIVIATILFDRTNKKLIAKSTGKIAASNIPTNYFKLILKNGSNIVAQTSLQNNQNANNIKMDLNDKAFDFGYILELTAEPNTAIVTNFPSRADRFKTTSILKTIFFEITANGLITHNPPPTFLDNIINFRSASNISDAATIKFDIASKRLNVTADGNNVEINDKFDFILKSNSGSVKIRSSINGGQNGNNLANLLNNINFEIGDNVEIGTVDRSRALIDDLPIKPNKYFLPTNMETFIIAADGLKFAPTSPLANAQILPQVIAIQGKTNGNVTDILATVYFDTASQKLIAFSTGKTIVSNLMNQEYFALIIKDSSDNEIKTGIINTNENADRFVMDLNDFAIQSDYIISVRINQNA